MQSNVLFKKSLSKSAKEQNKMEFHFIVYVLCAQKGFIGGLWNTLQRYIGIIRKSVTSIYPSFATISASCILSGSWTYVGHIITPNNFGVNDFNECL